MSEALWLVVFKNQLARMATDNGLDTRDDMQYRICVSVFLELGKMN